MKILVADDSKTNLNLITHSLSTLGHDVVAVTSGNEAIEKFKTEHPDLVILDVIMDVMDGFECAKQLRKIDPDDWVPIIFLSGAVDDVNIEKGINAGGDDYLTKPFSDITLAAKIKAMQRISDMRSKLFKTTQQLQRLSTIDSLTEINNRLQFDRSLKERLAHAERHKKTLALLFIDLDNFKSINDNMGHHFGDLLLKETAKRLVSCIRADDFIARLGGDEFAIIVDDVADVQTTHILAKKIIDALSPVFQLENNNVYISPSIGIAYFPNSALDEHTLIQHADLAMYHAKNLGRNNFQHYNEVIGKQYKEHLLLDNELKEAVQHNELQIYYQPIIHLVTKEVLGVEAILQWQHPKIGLVTPDVFMPIAEEIGLTNIISRWALERVCDDLKQWQTHLPEVFNVSINISSRELLLKDFSQQLQETLKNTNTDAKRIQYEITDKNLMISTKHLDQTIHEIDALGVKLIIDHFGTENSSITHLTTLPIYGIKIDSAFIKNPRDSDTILSALINLGNNLNLAVSMDGIQTQEQCTLLIKKGCFIGQGDVVSKPLSVNDLIAYLKR